MKKKQKETKNVNPVTFIHNTINESVLHLYNKERIDNLTIFDSTWKCECCDDKFDVDIRYCDDCDSLTMYSNFDTYVDEQEELQIRQVFDELNQKYDFVRFILDYDSESEMQEVVICGSIRHFSKNKHLLRYLLPELIDSTRDYKKLFSEIISSDKDSLSVLEDYENRYFYEEAC
ncbi:MAG: hypothetical protein WCJ37_02710 [Syntrophus sp. (in: bacteria)]